MVFDCCHFHLFVSKLNSLVFICVFISIRSLPCTPFCVLLFITQLPLPSLDSAAPHLCLTAPTSFSHLLGFHGSLLESWVTLPPWIEVYATLFRIFSMKRQSKSRILFLPLFTILCWFFIRNFNLKLKGWCEHFKGVSVFISFFIHPAYLLDASFEKP